jgi:hypothetical protein
VLPKIKGTRIITSKFLSTNDHISLFSVIF